MFTRQRKVYSADIKLFQLKTRQTRLSFPCKPLNTKYQKRKRSLRDKDDIRAVYDLKPTTLSNLYNVNVKTPYVHQVFQRISLLGEGGFGSVYKVKSCEDNKYYAIKQVTSRNDNVYGYEEVYNNEKVGIHPNCVQFIMAWLDNGQMFIQMEYCPISLRQYIQNVGELPEKQVWRILYDILKALKHIHANEFIHRDVKPANIMISSDGLYKLADFGLMIHKSTNIKNVKVAAGDPRYMPEEIFDCITFSCDIYSLGITALELITNVDLPEYGINWLLLRSNKFPEILYEKASTALAVTIERMCNSVTIKRPTTENLLKYYHIKNVARVDKKERRQIYEVENEEIISESNENSTPGNMLPYVGNTILSDCTNDSDESLRPVPQRNLPRKRLCFDSSS